MSSDHDVSTARVRLPGASAGQPDPGLDPGAGPSRARRDSVRRVRRISTWTAAALLAGTGATTVALASHALNLGGSSTAASGSNSAAGAQGATAPSVNGAVATSGGSGVTTTKQVVNGHVVITKTQHGSHNSDN